LHVVKVVKHATKVALSKPVSQQPEGTKSVNTEKFSEAQEQYAAGDFRKSARLFLDAVEKGTPIGNGPAYHMAGNSFMRLKRYSDATVVYEHALRDDTYARHSAVEANLANAYVRTGEYDSAIAHYEAALNSGDAKNAYKLYQGTAQAYMQQQKFELAAIAYKHAALDSHNPTPGKSLLNLGLAMMASGNAEGAIEAYQTAVGCPGYENKGRALLNMGIAYHSLGKWEEAIKALEDAKMQPNYTESELAQGTLADARHRLELEGQVAETDQDIEVDDDGMVDPIEAYLADTAPAEPFYDPESEASAGADVDAGAQVLGDEKTDSFVAVDGQTPPPAQNHEVEVGKAEDVDRFFSLSETEVAKLGREKMKGERGRFFWVKWALIIVLLLGGLGGGAAALYFTGQGFPSAETTVTDLLESYSEGRSIAEYWTFGMQANIENKMVVVPPPESFTIDAVNSGPSQTTVRATIITVGEESFVFTFSLAREGIGWKVDGIVMEGMDGPSDLAIGDDHFDLELGDMDTNEFFDDDEDVFFIDEDLLDLGPEGEDDDLDDIDLGEEGPE